MWASLAGVGDGRAETTGVRKGVQAGMRRVVRLGLGELGEIV